MKFSQHRTLFFVVGLHAAENVVEDAPRGHDIRSLIEHDAFRALTLRCIRNVRPRGKKSTALSVGLKCEAPKANRSGRKTPVTTLTWGFCHQRPRRNYVVP